jgi:glycosyltransferase involved in cell wall biosynthesis
MLLERLPETRIEVVGNGVDVEFFASNPAPAGDRKDLVFMGKMDYHANIDAALYFVRKIWPRVSARRPDLRFVIVGANPPSQILALREQGITVTGTVDDVRPFYRSALAAIVPLRVGGGTRLKVLEAMAAGTPVISTTLGAEGLASTPGKDILIADTAEEITEAVASLRAGDPQWRQLVSNARQLVQTKYDWSVVGDILVRLHAEQVEVGAACLEAN